MLAAAAALAEDAFAVSAAEAWIPECLSQNARSVWLGPDAVMDSFCSGSDARAIVLGLAGVGRGSAVAGPEGPRLAVDALLLPR